MNSRFRERAYLKKIRRRAIKNVNTETHTYTPEISGNSTLKVCLVDGV